MQVNHKEIGEKGFFYIEEGENILAKMTYVWAETDRIIIDHTEVNDALRGKGAGKMMVSKAVDFARGKGIKIVPLCPFVKSVMKKVKEFQDVL